MIINFKRGEEEKHIKEGGKDKKEKNKKKNGTVWWDGHKAFRILMLTSVRSRPCADSALPFCRSCSLLAQHPSRLLTYFDPLYMELSFQHTQKRM